MELGLENIAEIAAMSRFANLVGEEADRLHPDGIQNNVALLESLRTVIVMLRTELKDIHWDILEVVKHLNREHGPIPRQMVFANIPGYSEPSLYRFIRDLKARRLLIEVNGGLVANLRWKP